VTRLRGQASGFHLVEDVIHQVVAALKAGLPAKLDALESQYDDSVILAAPRDDCYYTPTNDAPDSLKISYPAIFVVGGTLLNDTSSEGMGPGSDLSLSYDIGVIALCKGDTEVELQKRLYRYPVAIAEVLCNTGSLAHGTCFLQRIEYENPVLSPDDEYIRDVPMSFLVTDNESF